MSFSTWMKVSIVYAEMAEISDSIAPYASRSILAGVVGSWLTRYNSVDDLSGMLS